MTQVCRLWAIACITLMYSGCGQPMATPQSQPPVAQSAPVDKHPELPKVAEVPTKIEKLESKHLPNPVRVHAKVISGGLPEGDEAFAELNALGIKTIISVDGAKPNLAAAEKYGMRYVHLPHGYDGVPEERAKELAKAVRDLPGPIYIHCHHGKHRSPAAAAVACVGAGLIGRADAAMILKVAGTSESYRGLFQSAEAAHPLDKALLDELKVEFPSVATLPPMAQTMVLIEHVHDHLKQIEKAGWKAPVDQPALVPDHEALILREHFTELLRLPEVKAKPADYQQLLHESEAASQALEDALKSPTIDKEHVSKLFVTVNNNCKSCHQKFRDVPLSEKLW